MSCAACIEVKIKAATLVIVGRLYRWGLVPIPKPAEIRVYIIDKELANQINKIKAPWLYA